MSQSTIKVDPDDKKMKIDGSKLKKIILGTIQGNQFLYIFFSNLITSSILDCYS